MKNTVTTILILDETSEKIDQTVSSKGDHFIIDNLKLFDYVCASTFIDQNKVFGSCHHGESEILDVIEVGGNNAIALNTNHNIKFISLSSINNNVDWKTISKTLPKPEPEKFAVHLEGGFIRDFFSENQEQATLKILDYDLAGASPDDIITIDGKSAYLGAVDVNSDPSLDLSSVFK